MEELDDTDKRILDALQKNARVTAKELSFDLKLSQTPVYERIKRLEREGFVEKYVALLSKDKLGKGILAFCSVQLREHARPFLKKFEQEIMTFPEVLECYYIAGNFDYLLKVVIKDMNAYQHFLVNKLAALDNITNAQSMFVMTEIKWSTELPLE